MKAKKGFTLVEILIVVVILGILAAIVIPQFSDASTEANMSRLQSDLQMLRSQVQLYKIQHLDELPHTTDSGEFAQRLTETTDKSGSIDGDDFGPYMTSVPKNPFVDSETMFGFGTGTPPTNGDTHWWVDTETGVIHAPCEQGEGL